MSYKQLKRYKSSSVAIFLIFSMLIQTLAPLIQHRPGYIRSVEASTSGDENRNNEQASDYPDVGYVPPFTFPDSAETLTDIVSAKAQADMTSLKVNTAELPSGDVVQEIVVTSDGGYAYLDDATLIIFDKNSLSNQDIHAGFLLAVKFELLWLTNKRDYYNMISEEDDKRILMLQDRGELLKQN